MSFGEIVANPDQELAALRTYRRELQINSAIGHLQGFSFPQEWARVAQVCVDELESGRFPSALSLGAAMWDLQLEAEDVVVPFVDLLRDRCVSARDSGPEPEEIAEKSPLSVFRFQLENVRARARADGAEALHETFECALIGLDKLERGIWPSPLTIGAVAHAANGQPERIVRAVFDLILEVRPASQSDS